MSSPNSSKALQPGWNFISFPAVVGEVPVTQALPNFAGHCEQLTRLKAATGKFESFVNDQQFNQFDKVNARDGYCLYVTNATALSISVSGTPATPGSRELAVGANLLAGPAQTMSVSDWLVGLVPGVDYSDVKGFNPATGATASVSAVRPGESYYVIMLRAATWTPPATARLENPSTARFVYDGDGGRVKKITWIGTTLFLGTGYEVSPDGQSTLYVFAGGQRIAAKESTGALRLYHSDHLGSANVITDQGGVQVELTENTPYGSISRQEGVVKVAHKFTGQRLDEETGLYFYNARFYDPEVGRFVSPDSVVQASDPQSFNRYSYVLNNPIIFSDPTGHLPFFVVAVIAGALLGGATAAITGGDLGMGFLTGAIGGAFFGLGSAVTGFWAAPAMFAQGAASGAINARITGGDPFRSALSGGVGGLAGMRLRGIGNLDIGAASRQQYLGYFLESSAIGFGTGFADSLINGQSFESALRAGGRGAALSGGMAALNIAATDMQTVGEAESRAGGQSAESKHTAGFRNRRQKLAGVRPFGPQDHGWGPWGGDQWGEGYIGPMRYARGSGWDGLLETYAGPHDWLNDFFGQSYNELGYNVRGGGFAMKQWRGFMNIVNVPLATPFAGASVLYPATPYLIHEANK